MTGGIDAVIFDWGGTLTRWHDVDFHAESLALAQAAVDAADVEVSRRALHAANETVWGRSRDHQQSATVADLFTEAGLEHDPDLLTAYYEFWEPHTLTDPEVGPLFEALRAAGVKVGVLSNTIWPREWHEGFFAATACTTLSTVTSTRARSRGPSRRRTRSGRRWTRSVPPTRARCVYVGDRLFDDVWGAQNAGLRAIHVPHSAIPPTQIGHSEGTPDAVVHRLSEIPALVAGAGS